MKHLKTYKLFEDNSFDTIKDLIIPLTDKGFNVFFSNDGDEWGNTWTEGKNLEDGIRIEISKNKFTISEIKDDLEFLINFINSYMKFKMVNIHISKIYKWSIQPNDTSNDDYDLIDDVPSDKEINLIEIDFEKI